MTETKKFFSKSIQREMDYQIILPERYEKGKRYPVLFLFHGMNQDYLSWTRFSFIELFAQQYPYIFAIPDIDKNWYSVIETGCKCLKEYIRDFLHHVDKNYQTVPCKEGRGCCGISMGGYGSYYVAIHYPQLFNGISALSGVFNFRNHTESGNLNTELGFIRGSWEGYNLVDLISEINYRNLNLLFDTGIDDEISYRDSIELHEILNRRGILHRFNVYPGKHDWYYWNDHLEEHLSFHQKRFEAFMNFS